MKRFGARPWMSQCRIQGLAHRFTSEIRVGNRVTVLCGRCGKAKDGE